MLDYSHYVDPKQPIIWQDSHGTWWVNFGYLGPGAVQGPLIDKEAAKRIVRAHFSHWTKKPEWLIHYE